jgi:hypothetical protein
MQSRQVTRQIARAQAKAERSVNKTQSRVDAKRARLVRQSAREKSGFYEGGRGVAAAVAPSRSRVTKRLVAKGEAFGRHIRKTLIAGIEYALHPTKGWRKC